MTEEIELFGPRQGKAGPVHRFQEKDSLAWCGVRVQFRHRWSRGTMEQVTCPKCKSAVERGKPYSRKR